MTAFTLAHSLTLALAALGIGFRVFRACHYMVRGGGTAPPPNSVQAPTPSTANRRVTSQPTVPPAFTARWKVWRCFRPIIFSLSRLSCSVPLAVPVVANGEIWTVEHAGLARERSGCEHLMLGRGMVADPGLALRVAGLRAEPLPWAELLPLMAQFFAQVRCHVAPKHQGGRLKQWLHYLKRAYPEAESAYAELRTVNAADELAREEAVQDLLKELRQQAAAPRPEILRDRVGREAKGCRDRAEGGDDQDELRRPPDFPVVRLDHVALLAV